MFYLLSIGSNIEPEKNMGLCFERLLGLFGGLYSFPIVYTSPVCVESDNPFLNTMVIIWSQLEKAALKERLNAVETGLGRDRFHPRSSVMDRVCDIDIQAAADQLASLTIDAGDATYLRRVLAASVSEVRLFVSGVPLPEGATAVYLEGGAGDKVVVDDKTDAFANWLKTDVGVEQRL